MPAFLSTFSVTGIGPVSMIAGSEPILAKALMRARGFRPSRLPASRAADQHRGGAVDDAGGIAGVCTWLTASTSGCAASPPRRSRPSRPSARRTAATAPASAWWSTGRMCSSLARIVRPLTSFTGITDLLEAALVPGLGGALLALDRIGVDVVAREAVFGGDQVGGNALRQEIGLAPRSSDRPARRRRRRRCRRGSSIRRRRRWSCSCWPLMIWAAAKFTASRPEAQKRLIWMPGTPSPKPATSAAARAMLPPASPTGSTQPITTSSIMPGVELVAVLDRGQRLRRQIERGHLVQRAVGLAAAARRAHVVVDECIGHRPPASRCQSKPRLTRLRAISSFMISLVPA